MTTASLSSTEVAANWALAVLFFLGVLGCALAALSEPRAALGAISSSAAFLGLVLRKPFAYGLVVLLGLIGLVYSVLAPVAWLVVLNGFIIFAAIYVWRGVRRSRAT